MKLAVHWPPGRRLAERGDLQPADHRPSISVGPGGMAVPCAASDPDLHPGEPARVATLELEAEGGLTVEVGWGAVGFGCARQIRNHHTLMPEWEPWGSAYETFERSKHLAALRRISAMRGSPLARAGLKKGLDGVIDKFILRSFVHRWSCWMFWVTPPRFQLLPNNGNPRRRASPGHRADSAPVHLPYGRDRWCPQL